MLIFEHHNYAAMAVVGTLVAVWSANRLVQMPAIDAWLIRYRGVVPPFINVNAMLFGLTLAFIANDTWSARDRAMNAVFREADSLRSLIVLAEVQPEPSSTALTLAIKRYGTEAAEEFTALRQRMVRPEATAAGDALLRLAATPTLEATTGQVVQAQILREVMSLRVDRELRVSLSRTHLNPLKWLGMAALGLLTILSIIAVHLGLPRAGLIATILFALAAAPSAAIVLVQGNPFQEPAAISPLPIIEAVKQR